MLITIFLGDCPNSLQCHSDGSCNECRIIASTHSGCNITTSTPVCDTDSESPGVQDSSIEKRAICTSCKKDGKSNKGKIFKVAWKLYYLFLLYQAVIYYYFKFRRNHSRRWLFPRKMSKQKLSIKWLLQYMWINFRDCWGMWYHFSHTRLWCRLSISRNSTFRISKGRSNCWTMCSL